MKIGDEVRAPGDPGGFVGVVIETDTLNEYLRAAGKDTTGRKMRAAGDWSSFELTGKTKPPPANVGWKTK